MPLSNGGHVLTILSEGQSSEPYVINVRPFAFVPVIAPHVSESVAESGTSQPAPLVLVGPQLAITGIIHTYGDQKPVSLSDIAESNSVMISCTTTQPYDTVHLYVNDQELAMFAADGQGNWSHSAVLNEGQNDITVSSRGEFSKPYAFNMISLGPIALPDETSAAPQVVSEDAPAPVVPSASLPGTSYPTAITQVLDSQEEAYSLIPFLGNTSDTMPLIQGSAPAYSVVYIYSNQSYIGMVTSDGKGQWQYKPTMPLSNGGHTLTVVSEGQSSEPFVISVRPVFLRQ